MCIRDSSYKDLLKEINPKFLPDLDWLKIDETVKGLSEFLKNLQPKGEKTTYYLCRNYACGQPTDDWKGILKELL